MDKRLKTMGGVPSELMEEAKAQLLAENMNFSEAEPPSARSGAGYPSLGGFIETHFDFATCQRPDGSYYGTSGTCRKGSPVSGGVPKDAKKSSASSSKGGGGDVKSLQKTAKDLDKKAKSADKAANKADAAWKKGGAKTGTPEHKKVKELDKVAKEANKRADKADKAYQKAAKAKPKSTNTAGMTLRDAQRQGLTTSGSKNPDWKSVNEARAARKTVKKTSNKDRAKD